MPPTSIAALTPTPEPDVDDENDTLTYAQAANQPLGHILRGMQLTGHNKWGFLVYRTFYSPAGSVSAQARFDAYMAALREHVAFALKVYGYDSDSVLSRSFHLTVVEDAAALDGASKATVQKMFRQWVTSRSVERDGRGADFGDHDSQGKDLKALVPRYRMCLYVDEECLKSIEGPVHPRTGRTKKTSHRAVVIDVDVDEEDEQKCWMWLCLVTTVGLYQEACWRAGWDLLWRDPGRGEVFNS